MRKHFAGKGCFGAGAMRVHAGEGDYMYRRIVQAVSGCLAYCRIALLPLIAGCTPLLSVAQAEPPPNILFVLVDDLGYGDLGYSGSALAETPNIDRFARANLMFTHAYAPSPHCSPTRAAIMTGQYPARLHITSWIGGEQTTRYRNLRLPKQKTFLERGLYTLAEYLKEQGYNTVNIGKWHLGGQTVPPREHGFDEVIGFAPGASPGPPRAWFGPYSKIEDLAGPEDEYITDRLTTEAIAFMRRHAREPFLVMLQHYDVHNPLCAPKGMVDKYVAIGRMVDEGRENATYLAMKESTDASFGRLIAALDELDLTERTIVIFYSDNGGVSYYANNGPLRAGKKWFYEGGIRVPLVMRVPSMTGSGRTTDAAVSGIDFFPTLVELTGGDPGTVDTVFDGVSFVDVLKGSDRLDRKALFWHQPLLAKTYREIPPQGTVIMGDWKLIYYYGDTAAPELYNLAQDISETKNLAELFPERVIEMRGLHERHLDDVLAQRVDVLE